MTIQKKAGFAGERYLLLPMRDSAALLAHALVNQNYITEIGYYPAARFHYRERPHGAAQTIFLFCVAGRGTVEFGGATYPMTAGTICFIPANTPHRYFADPAAPWTIMWFHFASQTFAQIQATDQTKLLHLGAAKQARIEQHFSELLTLLEQEVSIANLICASNYLTLIITESYFMQNTPVQDLKAKLVSDCIAYMNSHLETDLTAAALAKHAGVSISYLNQLFRQYAGRSPIELFIESRMNRACSYLRLTDMRVGAVATTLGYHDPFYFSKLFKKTIGLSPKAYREQATAPTP
ncbi:AraC family transcriptional regulator [Lacticaseibacillus parakribbianus]|uniref:AraC family transcriptional regulator n=1 Tax=Lacticaseibacillus parakribbianus TaxID=2970927 RepID=UPI0021CAF3DE|nr:AraC family transcriptional regulator [Lacticaseibacillus parakribbianus]